MRRILVAIASAVMAFVMSVTCLTGCNLVTVDTERDMNQLVATVQITTDAPQEKIYKKDMVMAYLNYGYYYEQYYGYTRTQVFTMIKNNLVNSRVYVQNAMLLFDAGEAPFDGMVENSSITDKWNIERYLSDKDMADAKYSAYKDMNDLIESYTEDDEEDKVGDTMVDSVRAVPTGASNDEELTDAEKAEYVQNGIDTSSTEERRRAFNKVINLFEANGLLGEDYKGNDITKTEYYKETLNNYYENTLIEKYEKCITEQARKSVTFGKLEEEYLKKYNEQRDWTTDEFVSALSSASATDPILYANASGYGFVYNLLLGASDEVKEELTEWKNDHKGYTVEQYEAAREHIFNEKITVKDLRTSWILSGYDFDGTKFTGDYTLVPADSLPYKGSVNLLNGDERDEKDYKAEYNAEPTEMSVMEFIELMDDYVYGTQKSFSLSDGMRVDASEAKAYYDKRVKELMFAFSTDDSDSALNTYKGYAVKPEPDGSDTEEYQKEFAKAAREVLTLGKNSYVMIATDYGYHVIFYSEAFSSSWDFDNLIDYLNNEYGTKEKSEWESYYSDMISNWDDFENTTHYLYVLHDSLASTSASTALTNAQNDMLNKYVYSGDKYVVVYESVYADLLSD